MRLKSGLNKPLIIFKRKIIHICATARKFGVPRIRLARRFHRTYISKIETGEQNKTLYSKAERVLYLYIDFAEQICQGEVKADRQ